MTSKEELFEEYGFSGRGGTDILLVEKYNQEGDLVIRDYTENENLINRVESCNEILGYTENYENLDNELFRNAVKELDINLEDVSNIFGFYITDIKTVPLCAGYLFYSSKFEIGMKAYTDELI
jgi:hypothetical protein